MKNIILRLITLGVLLTSSAFTQSEFLESNIGINCGLDMMASLHPDHQFNGKGALDFGFGLKNQILQSAIGIGVKVGYSLEDQDFIDNGLGHAKIAEPWISLAMLTNRTSPISFKGVFSYYHAKYDPKNLTEGQDSFGSETYKYGVSLYKSISLGRSFMVSPSLSAIAVRKKAGYDGKLGTFKLRKIDYKVGCAINFKVDERNAFIITPSLAFPKISNRSNGGFINEDNRRFEVNLEYLLNL